MQPALVSCFHRCIISLASRYCGSEHLKVSGGLAEWSKAAVLKTVEGLSPPKVQILSPPPFPANTF